MAFGSSIGVVIETSTFDATSATAASAIGIELGGNATVRNTEVMATAPSATGVFANGDIEIEGGSVLATGTTGTVVGFSMNGASLRVRGTTVTAVSISGLAMAVSMFAGATPITGRMHNAQVVARGAPGYAVAAGGEADLKIGGSLVDGLVSPGVDSTIKCVYSYNGDFDPLLVGCN
jgi:formylmethanofuran dehydrogenase subunit C